MARLADMLENYRNALGRANWSIGRDLDVLSGYDPELADFVERSSLGTGAHGLGAGGLAGMIKASHGSPHAFTKFDLSKIGTGEGAQRYGHGMYFGQGFDSPTAKQYQENVKDMAAIQALNDRMTELAKMMHADEIPGQYRKYKSDIGRNAAEEYDALMDQRNAVRTDPGHLYNVELKWPDAAKEASDPLGEHHLLDWEASIANQPAHVQEAISNINKELLPQLSSKEQQYMSQLSEESPAAMWYQTLARTVKPESLSKALLSQNIPGLKYLDQASRNVGQGTRNYVIFDQDIPNIVSRNGVSLSDLLRR